MTYTPGPWIVVVGGGGHRRAHAVVAGKRVMAHLEGLNDEDSGLDLDANARLIAAAPDMLAALEQCADLLWQYGGDQSSDDGWKTEELRKACLSARAAITKATGEQMAEPIDARQD